MIAMRYHSTNKTVYSAKCHLIWCPKDRRWVLVGGVEERLRAIVAEVAAEVGAGVGAGVIEVEVMPGHVHLLVEIPSTVGGALLAVVRRDVENQVENQRAASRR